MLIICVLIYVIHSIIPMPLFCDGSSHSRAALFINFGLQRNLFPAHRRKIDGEIKMIIPNLIYDSVGPGTGGKGRHGPGKL